jgi:hypothetical protein
MKISKSFGFVVLLILISLGILITFLTPSLVYHVTIKNQTDTQLSVFVVDVKTNKTVSKKLNAKEEHSLKLCSADSFEQVSENTYLITALDPKAKILHNEVLKFVDNKVRYEIKIQE